MSCHPKMYSCGVDIFHILHAHSQNIYHYMLVLYIISNQEMEQYDLGNLHILQSSVSFGVKCMKQEHTIVGSNVVLHSVDKRCIFLFLNVFD